MFSANPNYTAADVKRYIIESAYADDFTGDVPNLRWGHGKLDVLRALEFAINGGASGSFDANENLSQPENGGGGSSCQLVTDGTKGGCAGFAMLATLALMTIAITRRRSFQKID